MELKIENGDYVPDGAGGLMRVEGREELLQRVLFRLSARRGSFPFCEELGSRIWQLGRMSASARQSAAVQFVTEALADEEGISVESVELGAPAHGTAALEVLLEVQGERLRTSLEVRM